MRLTDTLLVGPPGSGRTSFARKEAKTFYGELEETVRARSYIYRVAGLEYSGDLTPPFRAPHHTASKAALIGTVQDGYLWRPGEFSLAHGGTLFLDELPEFGRDALDALRDPLERGVVIYDGTEHHFQVPAHFRLIAAMHPCPCGWFRSSKRKCSCTSGQIDRYHARVPDWLRLRCTEIAFNEEA